MVHFTCKRASNVKPGNMLSFSEKALPLEQKLVKPFFKFYIPLSGSYSCMNLYKTENNDRAHKKDANSLS